MVNKGDKFVIEIGEVLKGTDNGAKLYRIKGFNSLGFDKNGIDKLEKCNENEIEEAYQKGMNEIWAFVGEIECLISAEDLEEIFGKDVYNCYNGTTKDIIEAYTATEALEKFENWRKERLSIKLGDVVKSRGGTVGIVVDVKDSDLFKYTVLYPNEFMIREYNPSELTKTGKHCDGIEDFKKLMTNLAVDLIKGEV